ncbi:bis(5'-nucleosyl)-tetraphosphatase PrpE [Alteribacter natronophilus]|uniref:bis(5'-nucleosyl)-tetraphosphatase PrpE n=1 Tax=Alteribacter natronophilus TaxID=2583810 RepID=UPI00110E4908|nr:bis(5'-nucleosyl)-tetraphosphatase PrpE [Alteribacter natronophilus]TMW72942.1 bis(5'-nucleosyl)-tetraphosphatase PrpE [Alteribacter natronophilus]
MFDIIGDIHGCYEEMDTLLQKAGYKTDTEGLLSHPDQRTLVSLGDLTDRGPYNTEVLKFAITNWKAGRLLYCPGNHCDKLYRYFLGRNVKINNGLETTVAELDKLNRKEYTFISEGFKKMVENSPLYLELDRGGLVVAHAGIRGDLIGKTSKKVKTFVLYGDITGETHPDGRPVRRDWAKEYTHDTFVVYGHTPVKEPRFLNHTVNIDTGCVFGNTLTLFQWPEKTTISVDSTLPYVAEKFREPGE